MLFEFLIVNNRWYNEMSCPAGCSAGLCKSMFLPRYGLWVMLHGFYAMSQGGECG